MYIYIFLYNPSDFDVATLSVKPALLTNHSRSVYICTLPTAVITTVFCA